MALAIGLLLGIALMIFMAWKGWNVLILAPVAAIVIALTNHMPVAEAMLGPGKTYFGGLGGFLISYMIIFLLGSLLGKYMEDSKATITIANSIFKLTGKDDPYKVLLAIALIGAALTYGGVTMFIFIFAVVALGKPIFRELNLPWKLVLLPMFFGGCTITMSVLPATPSIQNVVPTAMGTPLTSAAGVSLIACVVVVAYGLWYMKWQLNKALESGEGYVEIGQQILIDYKPEELPSLFASVLPLLVVVGIIVYGSAAKMNNVAIIALLAGVIVSAILYRKYIPNQLATLNVGATNAVTPLIFTAAATGVGSVVTQAPGFTYLMNLISGVPGGVMTQAVAVTAFLSCASGSAAGALGIIVPQFGPQWIAAGANPELLHRVMAITSAAWSAMPHAGFVFSCIAVFGLKHKQVYKDMFALGFCGANLALITVLLLSVIFY